MFTQYLKIKEHPKIHVMDAKGTYHMHVLLLSCILFSIHFFDVCVRMCVDVCAHTFGGYCSVKQNGSEPGFSNHIISFY